MKKISGIEVAKKWKGEVAKKKLGVQRQKFLEHEVSKLCWDGVAIIFGGRVANFFLTCDRR